MTRLMGFGVPSGRRPWCADIVAAPSAHRPPYEWPTRSIPPPAPVASAIDPATARTSSNSRSIVYPGASVDAPLPRRSTANTRRERAKGGPTTRKVVWSAPAPWIRRSGGRDAPGLDAGSGAVEVGSAPDLGTSKTASRAPSPATTSSTGSEVNGVRGAELTVSAGDGVRRELRGGRSIHDPQG